MELLEKSVLPDGRTLCIYRQITPDAAGVPERLIRYMIASIGFDSYRRSVNDQNYWRLYYRTAFAGEGAVDHLYLAEVDGEFAARVWFAYSPETGFGNFGNVYTETNYRKLGLMKSLMKYCTADFYASSAKMLCCSTGTEFAAAAYIKSGFHLIYGGKTGPLCLLDPEWGTHYLEVAKLRYDGSPVSVIRPGGPGDQYGCDKFLAYLPEMKSSVNERCGGDAFVSDYRVAWQEKRNGNAVVCVAENQTGAPVGFAYGIRCFGRNYLNFTIHPDNAGAAGDLIRYTLDEFRKAFPASGPVSLVLGSRSVERLEALKRSGLEAAEVMPEVFALLF